MTEPEKIDSITSFFEISHYEYRIFDMGHVIHPLSKQDFKLIENQQEPYPTPFKQKAWLGILFWQPDTEADPVIWFLHLPIDELGLLKLEARDSFIQQLIEQVSEKIKQEADHSHTINKTEESPFAFKPNQDKMAIFNALANRELKRPASKFFEHTTEYLDGQIGYDQWTLLGLQGIADVVTRLDDPHVLASLMTALPEMPEVPLSIFLQMLEHTKIPDDLSAKIITRLTKEVETGSCEPLLLASFVRALSASITNTHRGKAILLILENNQNIEILAAIASRCWKSFHNKEVLKQFLQALSLQPQESFNSLISSIMTIPGMRKIMLDELSNTDEIKGLEQRKNSFMHHFHEQKQ